MSVTKTEIRWWNPSELVTIADSWTATARGIEELFTRYKTAVTTVNGSYWEGRTAEAAQNRAGADYIAATRLADHLERAAGIARNGFHEIDPHLRVARDAIAEATAATLDVAEDLTLSTDRELSPEQTREMERIQGKLNDAAAALREADTAVTDDLSAVREDLLIAFVAPGALGGEQGASDAESLTNDPASLSDTEVRRLIEAGSLTQGQVDALLMGEPSSIPASQMEYMAVLARALDELSPREIESLLNDVGDRDPAAKVGLANVLQMLSNENITASVQGDEDVPTNGSFGLLPQQIRASLEREDLTKVHQLRNPRDEPVDGTDGKPAITFVYLNGVADNQAIARIAGAADDSVQVGTSLDAGLAEVGRQYLHAQIQGETATTADFESNLVVDGERVIDKGDHAVTEPIFEAISPDKIIVQSLVSGEGGHNFIRDALSHEWVDDGSAVGKLFIFEEGTQVSEPQDGPLERMMTARAGAIMEEVARAISSDEARDLLLNVPNSDNGGTQSAGERNPLLVRQLSESLYPYMSEMAGGLDIPDNGFSPYSDGTDRGWLNSDGRFGGLANIFSIMGTDGEAGEVFRAAAMATILSHEGMFASNPNAPGAAGHLMTAGYIQGAMDVGLYQLLSDSNSDEAAVRQQMYEAKQQSWERASQLVTLGKFVVGKMPYGDYINLVYDLGGGSSMLEAAMVGDPPTSVNTDVDIVPPSYAQRYWSILQAVDPELLTDFSGDPDYSHIFNEDGSMRSYDEALEGMKYGQDRNGLHGVYREMMVHLGKGNPEDAFQNAYESVLVSP